MLPLGDNISRRDRDFPDLYPFHYSLTETFYSPNNKRENWFLLSERTIDEEYLVLKYYSIHRITPNHPKLPQTTINILKYTI